MLNRHKSQAGDTIIEVMIALAVLGLAIGIGYSTATRSLLTTRAAQENAEATAILQAEVEGLNFLAQRTAIPTNTSTTFCIDPKLSGGTVYSTNIWTLPDTRCDNLGQGGLYNVSIKPIQEGAGPGLHYELTVTWDDALGRGTDTATMQYRPYSL